MSDPSNVEVETESPVSGQRPPNLSTERLDRLIDGLSWGGVAPAQAATSQRGYLSPVEYDIRSLSDIDVMTRSRGVGICETCSKLNETWSAVGQNTFENAF